MLGRVERLGTGHGDRHRRKLPFVTTVAHAFIDLDSGLPILAGSTVTLKQRGHDQHLVFAQSVFPGSEAQQGILVVSGRAA